MYGYNKPYKQLLAESGLSTLKVRREAAVLKFTKKCLDNPIYDGFGSLETKIQLLKGIQRSIKKNLHEQIGYTVV